VKKTIFVGMILPMMLYGAEVWVVTAAMQREMETAYMRMVRSMMRVNLHTTRKHRLSSARLLEHLDIHNLQAYIDQRRLGWAGHVARMPPSRLPRQLLTSYADHPRRVGAPCLTYGRVLRGSLSRRKIKSDWIITAGKKDEWRAAITKKLPQQKKSDFESNPGIFIGRTVEKKFKAAWHVGRIVDFDLDEATNEHIWRVTYPDGDFEDCNVAELKRIIISKDDQLELAARRLEQPQLLLGSRFTKIFQRRAYGGTVTDHDTDEASGETIWEVHFDDGDKGDYNLHELAAGLLQ